MFENITPEEIKRRIVDALAVDIEIDTREGSYTDALVGPAALEIWKIYASLNALLPIVYPDETSGEYLDKRCGYYGIQRKAGTAAKALLTVTGKQGTTVPTGAVFLTAEGLRFACDGTVTLTGTTADCPATATEVGSRYNVGAGQIIRPLTGIAGLTAVSNAQPASGGADAETSAALLGRLYVRLREAATSGNANHYKQWALEVEGVGAAKITPLQFGPGTVGVLIAGEGREPVDAAVVSRCAAHIEALRPVGAEVTVQSVESLNIDVAATVSIDAGTTKEAVREAFASAFAEYLQSISFSRYTVPYVRIGYLLAGVDGVLDYTGLTVNGGTEGIVVGETQAPRVGTVSIT